MDVKAIDFFAYTVEDMARSLAFYREMFGLEPEFVMEHEGQAMWAEIDVNGVTVALNASGNGARGGAVSFSVDDVQAALEEMKAKGAEVVFGPFESPVCWVAAVLDPDGNAVFLHRRHDGTCG
jgi:predicted enzyme related to lactoylglutathione lyase